MTLLRAPTACRCRSWVGSSTAVPFVPNARARNSLMSSPKDAQLLTRRFGFTGDTSFSDPAIHTQPGDPSGPPGGFPMPPRMDRQVSSVFDARPSFAREFLFSRFGELNLLEGEFAATDFNFSVPSGYVGVLRGFSVDWFGLVSE